LNIYELPSMLRVMDPSTQKRTAMKVVNVQSLEWKPNRNILCVAAYKTQTGKEKSENAGKIYLIEVPSRLIIKWKTITWEFNSVEINWETTGNKVVLVLKKVVKNKKISTVIQIGDIRHNNVTVEEHEFPEGKVVSVDESGRKIAILSKDMNEKDAQLTGYTVDLYRTDEEIRGKYFQKIGTFSDKPVSHVLWSSNGTFFALVNTDKTSAKIGFLEFGFIKGNNLEIIKSTKIPYMIQAAWDASGRYLCTSSSKGHYTIWTAFGEPIIKDNFTEITQIQWRPKPKVILPEELESTLAANLKKYSKKFEDEDDRILNEDKYKKEEIKKKQKEEFEAILASKRKAWEQSKKVRIQLLGFDEDNLVDTVYDEIIEGEEPLDTKK
jgi:translation initiation factor 3 subunit B